MDIFDEIDVEQNPSASPGRAALVNAHGYATMMPFDSTRRKTGQESTKAIAPSTAAAAR
ncbi:MAG TPA: hypothetical protein VLS89_12150 [Candidatus Nanopelagicales bacterium]|nr:hypothetical protein [Candidatus Nanopelagicales bacterium]